MRILALIFSAIGVYELLQLVNIEVYQFMRAPAGPEGGLITASISLLFGCAASVIALLFAFIQFRRAQTERRSQLLLAWCSLLPVSFIVVFIYASVHGI